MNRKIAEFYDLGEELGAYVSRTPRVSFRSNIRGGPSRRMSGHSLIAPFHYYFIVAHTLIYLIFASGNFSRVVSATRKKDGKKFAVKIIQEGSMDQHRMDTEINILKKAKHPNVINLEDVFAEEKRLYLVLELVTGGELFDKIVELGSYTEKDARGVVRQILDAVRYLHENNIVHRDLKPTNLLLKAPGSNEIKITDFGLSKVVGPDVAMQTACGTPIYVAPEVLEGSEYTEAVDLWSVGVIMYILLCGFPPFFDEDENMGALFEQIMAGDFDFPSPYWDNISDDAMDLIEKLLVVDPAARLSAAQALDHPWIKSTASKELPGFQDKFKTFRAAKN